MTSRRADRQGFDPGRLCRLDEHFQRYVDDGRLPGWQVLISRHGELVHESTAGFRDVAGEVPWTADTLVRMFSMTKPITTVAAMMLYEEGAFELKDEVAKFIPAFADSRVYRGGNANKHVTEALTEPMRLWHLMSHTSGLTYGFHHQHVTDALYRAAGYEWGAPPDVDLAAACDAWAALPLAFQPGAEWNYGVSTDVLGRVVEVVSGMPLDEFFGKRIFEPLGMAETDFSVSPERRDRAAKLYLGTSAAGPAFESPVDLNSPDGMPFWCDPVEDVAVVFLTQVLPSSTYPIRSQLKQLVYQALTGD